MVIIRMLWLAGLLVAQSSEDDKTDDDDLLSLLQDHQNSEVPREKYKELGFGDGYFNGKKIKRIVKVSDGDNIKGDNMVEGGDGSLEKVEDIEDVERFHKIKSLKPIKKMTQIDADLADKMRKEVRGEVSEEVKEPYYPPQDDPDLAAKVSRVLKMFNASDLDDIIKVVPISSMRKIKSKTKVYSRGDNILEPEPIEPDAGLDSARGDNFPLSMEIINDDRYGLSNHEPSGPGLNIKRYGAEKIETENAALKGLDDEIERISQTLVDNARLLDKERELQEVLNKMMNVQREKLMKIKEVMDDHRAKEMELSRKEVQINEMLKKAQQQKIHHLKELQNLAEKHINEIDAGGKYNGGSYNSGNYNSGSYNGGTYNDGSYNDGGYNDGGYNVRKSYKPGLKVVHGGNVPSDLYLDPEYKYISKRGYDVMPVKKIKSIKKLKSVLKLTDEQAARLAQWQQARNVDPRYMPA